MRIYGVIAALLLLVCNTSAYSQVVYQPNTAQGSYLNGTANVIGSQGRYLEGLGTYEKDHEVAEAMKLENRKQRIHDRWQIQDEYKARYYPRYQRDVHELNPSKTLIGYNGKYYHSWKELKADKDAMAHMNNEALKREWRREMNKIVEERKDAEALDFLRKWDKMDPSEKKRLADDREFRDAAPDLWWKKHHPAPFTQEEKSMARLYGYDIKD